MRKKGGKRPGAGRPKGSGDKNLQLVRDALHEHREPLIRKALKLALKKEPSIPVLLKLIDKVAPSLLAQQIEMKPEPFSPMTDEQLHETVLMYARLSVEREREHALKALPGKKDEGA